MGCFTKRAVVVVQLSTLLPNDCATKGSVLAITFFLKTCSANLFANAHVFSSVVLHTPLN